MVLVRLCFISFIIIDPDDEKQFWTPDIIIDQAKEHDHSKDPNDDVHGDDDNPGEDYSSADPDG